MRFDSDGRERTCEISEFANLVREMAYTLGFCHEEACEFAANLLRI